MKRTICALTAGLVLAGCLTACSNRTQDDNNTRMRTAQTGRGYGRYYADKYGDVADGHDNNIGQGIQDATNNMMDDARRMTEDFTGAVNDRTHN